MANNKEESYTSHFKGTGEDLIDDVVKNSRLGREAQIFITDMETGKPIFNLTTGEQLSFEFSKEEIKTAELTAVYEPEDERSTPRWIWHDPVIFDEESKQLFMKLSPEQRVRFTNDLMAKFYADRPEYDQFSRIHVYNHPLDLLQLFKSLSLDDFKACKISNAENKYRLLQHWIQNAEIAIEKRPIDTSSLTTIWPILSIREMFLESELSAFYYLKNPKKSARELATEKGAIMTTGGRIRDISYKDYIGWLDEIPNDAAYISYVGPHYWDGIEIDDGGNLYEGDEARVLRAVRDQDTKIEKAFKAGTFGDERPKEHERINKEVMRALFKATISEKNGIRTIYLPTFAQELNENYKIDVDEYDDNGELNEKGKQSKAEADQRAKEAAAAREKGEKVYTKEKPSIMQQFYSLDYWAGVLDRNEVTRTAVIVGLNKEAKTIDIVLPYLEKINQRVKESQELEAEKVTRQYLIPAYNDLVHSNIESERNKLAVDLVYTIIDGLLQRGSKTASKFKENQNDDDTTTKGDIVTYSIKYRTLINKTPLLRMAYKNATTADQKYKLLTRTFKKAFQLLHKKTDIYKYFVDLKIPEATPTIRTLDNIFTITHKGRNKAYKKL